MKKKHILGLFAFAAMVTGFIYFGSNVSAQKSDAPNKSEQATPLNNTPQTLPFSQNWTNIGLITANDDWSMVPGIQAFQGNDLTTATGVDPRTILADGSATVLDVIANVANCDTNTSGGIAECEGAGGNPVIALQGSGTADVPYVILYLDTTGQSNIRVQYNARDVDGSADNAIQPINTQYRVGNTGTFINVPGGYIADASTGPSQATLVTPIDVTLPAAANNRPLVEVRISSTNAVGSDEWVGIDDISVTTAATPARNGTLADFNGDGRTDFAIVRISGGQYQWWIQNNGFAGHSVVQLGQDTPNFDRPVPADYDGDGKTDVAVWREGPPTQAAFYILQSSTSTLRTELFGQTGDSPSTVGDYDGDGKADVSVYRDGATPNAQSFFFYRGSLNNPTGAVTYGPWGISGDVQTSGDFDGDGKFDVCVRRDNGGGQALFYLRRSSDSAAEYIFWGLTTDSIIPGDYDGDGKHDFAVARLNGNNYNLYILERDGGGTGAAPIVFGLMDDDAAFGDYDGDGKQDVGIFRDGLFWYRQSSNGAVNVFQWGQMADFSVTNEYITGGN